MSEDVRLHYEVAGPEDAPAILFSGSVATSLELWHNDAVALADRYRVVRYDHRGHGRSPVPPGPYSLADLGEDVVRLLDSLNLASAAFCGLSLGGMVGMWLAAHEPDRITRLVTCCAMPRTRPGMWDERMALVRQSGMGELAEQTVRRWFTPSFRQRNGTVVAAVANMVQRTPAAGYLASCQAMADMDLWQDLPRIRARTTVVAGAEDRAMTAQDAEAVAATIRIGGADATAVILPDATHLLNLSQPVLFEALLHDCLDH